MRISVEEEVITSYLLIRQFSRKMQQMRKWLRCAITVDSQAETTETMTGGVDVTSRISAAAASRAIRAYDYVCVLYLEAFLALSSML